MKHILIIDDDPSVLSLFRQFLESEGFSTALAANGHEGMHLMEQQRPDLVITDIMMPEMDGLELLLKIKKNGHEIPVIAISGGMKDLPMNFLPHAKKFGADRVFEKPVSLANLLKAVHDLTAAKAEN